MSQNLNKIFSILFKHFGEQNWWPAESPFEVIVGAILTQNTSWKNVEKSLCAIKEKGLLSPESLYLTDDKELAALIKSSGFYNLKARRLKNFLTFFKCFDFDLKIMKKDSDIRKKLLGVKGIGKETADSILLYALQLPYFVVDSYTKRIFHRLGFFKSEKIDYDEVQQFFHKSLPRDERLFNEYHALIVETAKKYCKKKPSCSACPLKSFCKYAIAKPIKRETETAEAKTKVIKNV
ncbi:MAG: endonuclease III domain-containing protein [bacterium]